MSPPIWIVENKLSFQDIIDNECGYIDAWETIVRSWIFEPAGHLASGKKVTDRGIALLTLELAFFEPFGSILTGEDSDGKSQKTFSKGTERFADWLFEKDLIGKSEKKTLSVIGTNKIPNIVYSFARCGLMHKMTMKGGRIFIDARTTGPYAISEYRYPIPSQAEDGSIKKGENILLIDPWRLLPQLERFLSCFVGELHGAGREDNQYRKFKSTFRTHVH